MNTREIQKLRKKFIGIAMLSFFLVMFFIGALINTVNYVVTQREIQWSLEQIIERQDAIEEEAHSMQKLPEAPSFIEVFSPSYQRNIFYIFFYDTYGNELSFHASRGNTYPENIIRENAEIILTSESTHGRYGLYYYQRETGVDGITVLVMLDSSAVIFYRMRLLYASIAVGIIGMLITFILVIALSNKMIQPEIENSKKQMQFLTNVSHELKTPLAVIRSNAEMEELDRGESEWMQSTIRQVDRMNGLLKNLVMITKSRELESKEAASKINVSSIVAETTKEFYAIAEKQGKKLEQKIDADIELPAEESKLRQLTMILLDNAIKYCDENGSVLVSLERLKWGRKGVRLVVSNSYAAGKNGDYTRFFDRFYREDASHNIDTGGYGIGLSIAENICTQYKGSIHAEWHNGMISFICDIL